MSQMLIKQVFVITSRFVLTSDVAACHLGNTRHSNIGFFSYEPHYKWQISVNNLTFSKTEDFELIYCKTSYANIPITREKEKRN